MQARAHSGPVQDVPCGIQVPVRTGGLWSLVLGLVLYSVTITVYWDIETNAHRYVWAGKSVLDKVEIGSCIGKGKSYSTLMQAY